MTQRKEEPWQEVLGSWWKVLPGKGTLLQGPILLEDGLALSQEEKPLLLSQGLFLSVHINCTAITPRQQSSQL